MAVKKKAFLTILLMAMIMTMLAGCGGAGSGSSDDSSSAEEPAAPVIDVSSLKTMGDVFEATEGAADDQTSETGEYALTQSGFTEKQYAYVFKSGDDYYRATADLPKDVSEELWKIDGSDEDGEQKQRQLIAPLEISKMDNLTEGIPSQEELDKLVGTKGQELFDDGWTFSQYNVETMECVMYHDAYAFNITFDYDGEPMKNADDVDPEQVWKDSPVASISYNGIGDAINLE